MVGDQIGSAHSGFLNCPMSRSPYGVAGSHAGNGKGRTHPQRRRPLRVRRERVHVHVDNRLALLCGERYHQNGKRCNGGKNSHRAQYMAIGSSARPPRFRRAQLAQSAVLTADAVRGSLATWRLIWKQVGYLDDGLGGNPGPEFRSDPPRVEGISQRRHLLSLACRRATEGAGLILVRDDSATPPVLAVGRVHLQGLRGGIGVHSPLDDDSGVIDSLDGPSLS